MASLNSWTEGINAINVVNFGRKLCSQCSAGKSHVTSGQVDLLSNAV